MAKKRENVIRKTCPRQKGKRTCSYASFASFASFAKLARTCCGSITTLACDPSGGNVAKHAKTLYVPKAKGKRTCSKQQKLATIA